MKIKCLLLLGVCLLMTTGCYTVPQEEAKQLEAAGQLSGAPSVVLDALAMQPGL